MSLIDPERLAAVRTMLAEGTKAPKDPLTDMSPAELRRLRAEIDRLLPEEGSKINDINLETELVDQYNLVKDLQAGVLHDDSIPLNQRSQLAGQVAATLGQLVKMQVDLKRGEQLKRIESALLEAIDGMDEEAKTKFFTEYERLAAAKGAME